MTAGFEKNLPSTHTLIEPALVVGVNNTSDLFIRATSRQYPQRYNILGIIDDTQPAGDVFHGIRLLGHPDHLEKIISKLKTKPTLLILTDNKIAPYRTLINTATKNGLAVRRVPSLSHLKDGSDLTDLKQVMIEDLLGRECIHQDMPELTEFVAGKTITITGAGGSIGSELCRQVAHKKAEKIVLIEHSELALYHIEQELRRDFPDVMLVPRLIDVRNCSDIAHCLQHHRPAIVFHAAAYKHVPLVENNPIAGIENNLIGTMTIVDEAIRAQVEKVVIISTDKAVNPTNIMGATKRAAETYALWRAQQKETTTDIIAVRFGNVLGSNGSVIPLFKKQLYKGGPLTVTHKDVTRYFMTIPEAVTLVLQAAKTGHGNNLFMLDMGEPVKIWHLAEQMIRLSGLVPHEDIAIQEVGLRPGEKLFEELSYDAETMEKTSMNKIYRVTKTAPSKDVHDTIQQVIQICKTEDCQEAVRLLKTLVPEYTPAHNSPYYKKGTTS